MQFFYLLAVASLLTSCSLRTLQVGGQKMMVGPRYGLFGLTPPPPEAAAYAPSPPLPPLTPMEPKPNPYRVLKALLQQSPPPPPQAVVVEDDTKGRSTEDRPQLELDLKIVEQFEFTGRWQHESPPAPAVAAVVVALVLPNQTIINSNSAADDPLQGGVVVEVAESVADCLRRFPWLTAAQFLRADEHEEEDEDC